MSIAKPSISSHGSARRHLTTCLRGIATPAPGFTASLPHDLQKNSKPGWPENLFDDSIDIKTHHP